MASKRVDFQDKKVFNILKLNSSPQFAQQSPLVRQNNWRNYAKIAHSPRMLEERSFIFFHQISEVFIKGNIMTSVIIGGGL